MANPEPFVPALRFHALTRVYDRVLALSLDEERHKQALVAQAQLVPGMEVLDLGCGTGTLTLALEGAALGLKVTGLDLDPEALAIARRKAREAGAGVTFVQGSATDPPLDPGRFDRVVTSLLLHHLDRARKQRCLRAVRALLRPGGELHVLDWGRPQDPWMALAFVPVRLLDGLAPTRDNVQGDLPGLLREAGFEDVAVTRSARTVFGSLEFLRGRRGTS
jgi:ubiquinone/menaquinone biosynthesis C-methylase UbiE